MEKKTTDKTNVRIVTGICAAKGIKHVVISPGSRNSPLSIAFNREKGIRCHVIVDERCAGFYALGMAQQLDAPVALVCTSGTALLNYGPAIAEAFYQRIPLVVISADRPVAWIDQDDSQTIRQYKVFDSIVKKSYQLPEIVTSDDDRWFLERSMNEAINLADSARKGPVHINVPLTEPLYGESVAEIYNPKIIERPKLSVSLDPAVATEMASQISTNQKVMVFASVCRGDVRLESALNQLAKCPNIVVMTETVSNLRSGEFIQCVDRTLSRIPKDRQKEFVPDILITFGGPILSRFFKMFIKENGLRVGHWHIGREDVAFDTLKNLTMQIDCSPVSFFEQISPIVLTSGEKSDYSSNWHKLEQVADKLHNEYVSDLGWCDLKAFSIINKGVPKGSNLQLSNGTSVRYHQLFKNCRAVRVNSNRGTSGIDGSTSTAAGAAKVFDGFTTLITGDISFLYDSNALWNKNLSHHLRIIVLNNGGGGIFRFIKGPSELEELEEYFETPHSYDLSNLAQMYGLNYIAVHNEKQLEQAMRQIYAWKKATIVDVMTPREVNGEILRDYFKEKMK